jgi:hypothetical protein
MYDWREVVYVRRIKHAGRSELHTSSAPGEAYGTNESGESTNRRVVGFPHAAVAVDTFLAAHYY